MRRSLLTAPLHERWSRLFEGETPRLLAAARKRSNPDTTAARKRFKALDKEIANLTAAIRALGISPALRDELRAAEQEKERLGNQLDTAAVTAPDLPKVLPAQRFRRWSRISRRPWPVIGPGRGLFWRS